MSQLTCGHIQHMYSWWWVRLSPETCRVKPLRRIKRNCCILLDLFHYYIATWKLHVACSAARVQRSRVRCLQTMPPGQQDSRQPAGQPADVPVPFTNSRTCWFLPNNIFITSPGSDWCSGLWPSGFECQSLPAKLGVDEATCPFLWSGVLSIDRQLPQ